MAKIIKNFLSKIIVVLVAMTIGGAYAITTNLPDGDIGDSGTWATANNLEQITTNLRDDINALTPTHQTTSVPIEARVSIAFMNAMSHIGKILDSSLVRFALIFMLVSYAFWIGLEAYNMMTSGADAKKLIYDLIIKGAKIAAWVIIIRFGPATVFMWIMGPVLSLGTYMANLILDAVLGAAGVSMSDSCVMIHQYAAQNISATSIIDATAAADMICLPAKLTEFFRTTLLLGFKWVGAGILSSVLTFGVGVGLIIMSVRCIWKFMFMAIGVVADLFLAVLLLPFTAIAETTSKTKYKGIIGDIFNTFTGLFSSESLETQIKKFISAALYFVSLSIVIGVSVALLSGVLNADLLSVTPTFDAGGWIIVLLVLRLVEYLVEQTDKIATEWGGKIQSDFGDNVKQSVKTLWKDSVEQFKSWKKAIEDSKKS